MTYQEIIDKGLQHDASGITDPHAHNWYKGPLGVYYPERLKLQEMFGVLYDTLLSIADHQNEFRDIEDAERMVSEVTRKAKAAIEAATIK